jgi:hypothetical protein
LFVEEKRKQSLRTPKVNTLQVNTQIRRVYLTYPKKSCAFQYKIKKPFIIKSKPRENHHVGGKAFIIVS